MANYDFPHDIALISNVKITHNTPQYITESLNLQTQSKDRGLHRLEGSFDVTIEDDDIRKFESFLLKVRGRLNNVIVKFGGRFNSETVFNVPNVTSTTNVASQTLPISSLTGLVSEGDFFNITNDQKLYMCLSTTSSGGTMDIYPPLRQTVSAGTSLIFSDVAVLVKLTKDKQTINYTQSGKVVTFSFKFEEALT